MVLFWVLIVAVAAHRHARGHDPDGTDREGGQRSGGIGAGGTIVLGIWLAFSYGGYDIWDGWIIAAIVLWAVAAAVGQRTGTPYMQGMNKAEGAPRGGADGAEPGVAGAQPTQNGVPFPRARDRCRGPDPHRHDLEARA